MDKPANILTFEQLRRVIQERDATPKELSQRVTQALILGQETAEKAGFGPVAFFIRSVRKEYEQSMSTPIDTNENVVYNKEEGDTVSTVPTASTPDTVEAPYIPGSGPSRPGEPRLADFGADDDIPLDVTGSSSAGPGESKFGSIIEPTQVG